MSLETKESSSNFSTDNQPDAKQLHWSFWVGVAFFISVIVSILFFSWHIHTRMSATEATPVSEINISGEMPYTVHSDIEEAIAQIDLGNFFNVNVDQVQQEIAALPWVYSVSVRKQWPNKLNIYVVDQRPIARWNGDFFLNKEGRAFQAERSRVKHALPAFFGPEGSENIALENFENLNNLLGFSGLAIDELVLSERFAWQLTLNDGVLLNLGRENRVERVQRFMDIYPQIKRNAKLKEQVDYVDLRYDTGLAVGWKPTTNKLRVNGNV